MSGILKAYDTLQCEVCAEEVYKAHKDGKFRPW